MRAEAYLRLMSIGCSGAGPAWHRNARAASVSVSNPTPITINDGSLADPYPSMVTVSGFSAQLESVGHAPWLQPRVPQDVDVVLEGPKSETVLFMSDVGEETR